MRAILRLSVDLRVEIRIEVHDGVGTGEVDAESARARADEIDEEGRIGRVETVDVHAATHAVRAAVQAQVLVAAESEEILRRRKEGRDRKK
jgi:hypothetical protein